LHRRVEDAIAAGVIPSTAFGRKGFGEEPKFYDAWLYPGEAKWECIMPVSAQINPDRSSVAHTTKSINANVISSTRTLSGLNPFTFWGRPRYTPTSNSRNQPYNQSPSTPFTLSRLVLGGDDGEGNVQVSVLVAMPSPKSKSSFNPDEGADIPEIMVGVVLLPYRTSPEVSTSKLEGGGD